MTNDRISFLVAGTDNAPKTLPESIRQVSNASVGFCRSWLANDIPDALSTSEEAFELLDHIQNDLLRHRDNKSKLPEWSNSPFKEALNSNIGQLLTPASASDKQHFFAQESGNGTMPPGSSTTSLTLVVALNKLKHRDSNAVNFTVSSLSEHVLYIFTHSGMGKPDTISCFDIQEFCNVCKNATHTI